MSATTPAATARAAKLRAALHLSEPLAAISLFVLATACAALMLVRPREVSPRELPSLVLDAAAVENAIMADARAAKRAPRDAKADELRALRSEQGQSELTGTERPKVRTRRLEKLRETYAALASEKGEAAALTLRAEAAREFDAALDLDLPVARAKVVIGAFGQMLQREGASVDGVLTAPRFVARTLFKARWNLLHGLRPNHRFERIELRAYFGWQALHAERLPIPQRSVALNEYAKAGGQHAEEALGVLYFLHDDYDDAAESLRKAQARTPSFRLRNYALGAEARARAASDAAEAAAAAEERRPR